MKRRGWKLLIGFFAIGLAGSFEIPAVSAQSYKILCESTIEAWRHDTSLRDFMSKHDCRCPSPNQSPVCTPRGGGKVSSGSKGSYQQSSTGAYNSKQAFQMQMFQGLLGAMIQGVMQGSSSQPQAPKTTTVKLTMSPEEEARVKAHMEKMRNEYKKLKEDEVRTGLAGLKLGMKGRTAPRTEKNQGALAQLNCSAYLGIQAARVALSSPSEHAALEGPDEFARAFGEYSAQAEGTGVQTACPEVKTDIPDGSQPEPGDMQSGMYEFIISEIDAVIPEVRILQDRKKFAENAIAVKQDEIKELEGQRDSAATQNEKDKIDTLMQDALNALKEAQAEDAEATAELEKQDRKLTALQKMYSYYQRDDTSQK